MFIYILYSLLLETNFLFWTSSGCKHTPVPNPSPIQQKMGKIESPWPEKCQREAIKSILQTAWPLAKGDEEILRCWANLWIKETRSKGKYGNVMTLNTHSKHNTHQLQYPPSAWLCTLNVHTQQWLPSIFRVSLIGRKRQVPVKGKPVKEEKWATTVSWSISATTTEITTQTRNQKSSISSRLGKHCPFWVPVSSSHTGDSWR
jgi:hypothetical protein